MIDCWDELEIPQPCAALHLILGELHLILGDIEPPNGDRNR